MNRTAHVILQGGEDLVSSGIQIDPGRAQLLFNYACNVNGGYAKIPGYVIFDGSDLTLTYDTGDGTEPSTGQTITIDGITASITAIETTSGTWAGGDAAGTIEVDNVRGGAAAPSAGAATLSNGSTCDVTGASSITAVPGSGEIKGIWVWDDNVYAVRSNGATPAKDVLYVSSSSGWTAAPVGYTVAFTAGGGAVASPVPKRGDTLTQGVVTATISGVAVTSGDFEVNGNAVGYLFVHTIAGGNFSAAAATYGSGADAITLSGAQTATTLGDGDRYEFRSYNFSADADDYLMYFVNSVDAAFEYDGNALVAINSGRSPDTPIHIETHGQRLFLAFPGGDILFSSPGNPTTGFTQDYTAGSVAVGDECTGMQSLPGGTLALFGERNTKLLSGNISGADGDMQLKDHSRNIGAKEWTIQQMSDVYFISDMGASSLYQSDKFGDFAGAGLSQSIEPLIRLYTSSFIDSLLLKRKGHWRLFYQDAGGGTTEFVNATFSGGRLIGWTRGQYGFSLSCVNSGEIANEEVAFAGDTSGNVYQLETGRNWNGSDMRIGVILPYNTYGDTLYDKQWRKVLFQLDASETFPFSYAVEFNYSQYGWPKGSESTDETKGGGAFWGVGIWGTFQWAGTATYGTTELDTFGVGFNMAIVLTANDDWIPDHTLRAYSAIYEPRRIVR
jgi:hypothetical protein